MWCIDGFGVGSVWCHHDHRIYTNYSISILLFSTSLRVGEVSLWLSVWVLLWLLLSLMAALAVQEVKRNRHS